MQIQHFGSIINDQQHSTKDYKLNELDCKEFNSFVYQTYFRYLSEIYIRNLDGFVAYLFYYVLHNIEIRE